MRLPGGVEPQLSDPSSDARGKRPSRRAGGGLPQGGQVDAVLPGHRARLPSYHPGVPAWPSATPGRLMCPLGASLCARSGSPALPRRALPAAARHPGDRSAGARGAGRTGVLRDAELGEEAAHPVPAGAGLSGCGASESLQARPRAAIPHLRATARLSGQQSRRGVASFLYLSTQDREVPMWLFLREGFFSDVTAEEVGAELQVRARARGDLDALRDKYLPALGPTKMVPHRDYPFRRSPPRRTGRRAW